MKITFKIFEDFLVILNGVKAMISAVIFLIAVAGIPINAVPVPGAMVMARRTNVYVVKCPLFRGFPGVIVSLPPTESNASTNKKE